MPSNREVGDSFQRLVQPALERLFTTPLELDVPLPVGNPPHPQKFDFVSRLIELNPAYAEIAQERIRPLLAQQTFALTRSGDKVPRKDIGRVTAFGC